MGGGAILRSLTRAAISAPSSRTQAAGIAAAINGSSSRCVNPPMLQAAPALRLAAIDDWEVIGGEDDRRDSTSHDHLVFGSMPSTREVEEATSELQAALGMYVGDLGNASVSREPIVSSAQASTRTPSEHAPSDHSRSNSVLDWIEPHLVVDGPGTVQVSRRKEVADALHLLQHDAEVKGVVMSIASDDAVWKAVLSNKAVKELRKKLAEPASGKQADEESDEEFFLAKFLRYSKTTFLQLQSVLKDLFNSLLTFADKKFLGDKATDGSDKALKSCFMLGVMVVSIVLLKRAVVL